MSAGRTAGTGRDPLFSVIVTIVDGGDALRRCLVALANQRDPPDMEVIVPHDESIAGVDDLVREHGLVTFLPIGRVETSRPSHTLVGQHELFDRRRSLGLAAARGQVVALLEDRGVPRAEWARRLFDSHTPSRRVVGGAVENGVDLLRNWSVYFCDFGPYQPPFPPGVATRLSDVNVSYDRAVLWEVEDVWRGRYHEPAVHDALRRRGHALWRTPDAVVTQIRDDLDWRRLVRERVAWGRVFGAARARRRGRQRGTLLAAAAPIVPALMFARLLRHQLASRATPGRFVAATPALWLLLWAWSAGEAAGSLTGT